MGGGPWRFGVHSPKDGDSDGTGGRLWQDGQHTPTLHLPPLQELQGQVSGPYAEGWGPPAIGIGVWAQALHCCQEVSQLCRDPAVGVRNAEEA